MPDRLHEGSNVGLDEALLWLAIDEHAARERPRLERLWTYFRNPLEPAGAGGAWKPSRAGWYRLAQEIGLPARIAGTDRDPAFDDRAAPRREVVIENDIAWRVQTMIDFMFGQPVRLASNAADADTRRRVETALQAVWEASGGIALLQDAALLGHVYGHVDLVVRIDEPALRAARGPDDPRLASAVRVEIVDATRGVPLVAQHDYRELDAYAVRAERELNELEPADARPLSARRARILGGTRRRVPETTRRRRRVETVEVFTPGTRRVYEDRRPVHESRSTLLPRDLPVVHIQNLSQPFRYTGLGEVEALIPLQDELNTRLSDRASRVTMQSFKMYLARGLDGFEHAPVGPGQIWSTTNPHASIEAFGGDADSPSERAHIEEIREALDKASAVPPLAGGVIRAKIGNLSSANALRITLMSLLSKTARKRVTYGRGIERASALILKALDGAGVVRTTPDQRAVRVEWPDPLPEDNRQRVETARAKSDLGAPTERVLEDLGHATGQARIA